MKDTSLEDEQEIYFPPRSDKCEFLEVSDVQEKDGSTTNITKKSQRKD